VRPLVATAALLALLALLVVAGCGGRGSVPSAEGTWGVDVAATFGPGAPPGADTRFAPDAFALDLLPGGRFLLRVRQGPDAVEVEGTWSQAGREIDLAGQSADGTPLRPEEQVAERLLLEGEALVFPGSSVRYRRLR
jgi:hypothetical protein